MHPTTHAALNGGAGSDGVNTECEQQQQQLAANGFRLKNGGGSGNTAPRQMSYGTNGITSSNSNSNSSSNNATPTHNGHAQNGSARRDSAHIWTPLLAANGRGGVGADHRDELGAADGDGECEGDNDGDGDGDDSVSPRNNNEWKEAEEMNNLKNGLLHANKHQHYANHQNNHNNHHNHHNHQQNHHQHQHHHNHQSGNNNNSNSSLLLNGKNGVPATAIDKYDPEQDPLTGLYKPKQQKQHQPHHHHQHARKPKAGLESDESDFDSDLTGGSGGSSSGSGGSGSSGGGAGSGHGGKQRHGGSKAGAQAGCGLFGCRPRWARRFASTKCFMVVFLMAYILQGMYMTYFVSVITTIEKLFQIKSKTTGFLLSASEMGQISTAMLLTYFAGRGHRPRWIACGMVLFSIAAFSCSLPHFIFGKQLMQSAALLKPPSPSLSAGVDVDAIDDFMRLPALPQLDQQPHTNPDLVAGEIAFSAIGVHEANLCQLGGNATTTSQECNEDRKLEQASHSKITVIVLCIFFASLLSSGIGQTAVATLGIPYIDDNVASKQSPMYMAITIGVRILGPASGFIVGSFCTRWYVNFTNPGFNASDPRWIGAWWLGPVAIGTLMMLASIAMFSFPSQLRGKTKPSTAAAAGGDANGGATANGGGANATAAGGVVAEEKPKLKDFPKTVRRQLSNDILMFRTASCVFHLLPIAGLYTFLPKYLETQFRLPTYDANMVAAFCGILVMGIGIVISGLVILKLKPSARSVSAWIAFTALFYSAGMFILMFIGCSMNDFAGYRAGSSNAPAVIEPPCSAVNNCTCDKENFAPICGADGRIYISACHAGCTGAKMRTSDNSTHFSDCACIPPSTLPPDVPPPFEAQSGYCGNNCQNFYIFILIFAVCVFMHSTSEVGSMLLVMRCTHPKDKAMAMGVIQSAIGLFGNVPCPIIYGAVVDSACLIWKTVCGRHGACSLYNADTFRHYFLGITSGIMFLAFIMDIVVWSKAHRIDIALEDGNEHATNDDDDDGKLSTVECKKPMNEAKDTSV